MIDRQIKPLQLKAHAVSGIIIKRRNTQKKNWQNDVKEWIGLNFYYDLQVTAKDRQRWK